MDDYHTERKAKRIKRRNFVAKHNPHRAKKHASLKDYKRKTKYPNIDDTFDPPFHHLP